MSPTPRRKNKRTSGVPCAVVWCACLASVESQHCSAHRKNPDLHPGFHGAPVNDCRDCQGTRECYSCEGEGTHDCDRLGCYDEHDCGVCGGSGGCAACSPRRKWDPKPKGPDKADEAYLAWVNDAGWQPWKLPQPWDEA